MRRCYEWYELSRLYGSYGLPPSGPPPSAQAAMPRSALAPSPYDPHGCLMSSMVHPYYFQHPATAADPYRALGASLPADWSGMAALSDREREAMMMRASEEKEVSGAGVSGLGLKRSYPGELTREEALDLSVNKKRKLAESLAARDGALLYGLHGLRPPFPLSGTGAPVYPGLGSLEVAAAYPGLWGLPHSHPGASLSHPLTSTGGSPHPGLHYPHHSSAATSSCTATSSSSSVSKDHLHPHGHRDATSVGVCSVFIYLHLLSPCMACNVLSLARILGNIILYFLTILAKQFTCLMQGERFISIKLYSTSLSNVMAQVLINLCSYIRQPTWRCE